MQLNPKALGLTFGLLAGGAWLVLMALSLTTGVLDQTVQAVGGLHPGFSYTWNGALWIAVMHLVGGFVGGWVVASVYNKLAA